MNTRNTNYEYLYHLDQPRRCKHFDPSSGRAWGCSRGRKCKFAHVLLDEHARVLKRWPTKADTKKTVAYMTEGNMLGTEVQRANAPGKWLREFLQHQRGQPDILGDAHFSEGGSRVTFTLYAEPRDYLVELLQAKNDTGASQYFVMHDGREIKLTPADDRVAKPCEGVYYTDVWNALGTLVTGHLVGVDRSGRHGCHFAAIPEQGEIFGSLSKTGGVIFRARLHGMTLTKNAAPKIVGVVPIGVILEETDGGGFMTDMWSHELTEVTFCMESLLNFLQEWNNADRPRLSMPVPEITTKFGKTYSHRLIATKDFTPYEYDTMSFERLDERCERLQASHLEYKKNHDYEMSLYNGIRSIVHPHRPNATICG